MIISAKVILKPKKERLCPMCRSMITGPVVRLFGAADCYDKPYAMYVCPHCAVSVDGGEDDDKGDAKIRKAINESGIWK